MCQPFRSLALVPLWEHLEPNRYWLLEADIDI